MAERLNMEISLNKTKSLKISRNYTKCEIELRGTSTEQVPKLNYLGAEISAERDFKQEVRTQAMKAARISGCLYNLIWNNKCMSIDCKSRIYKANVRPVLTYASETRAETAYTQQLFRTTEMKTIRAIHGKTIRDKIRSDHLRHLSAIQDINKWTEARRREWDADVGRMEDNRLTKIARDSRPQGVRNRGRPKKRWKGSIIKQPPPPALATGRTGDSL
jgi:hypothetical protein